MKGIIILLLVPFAVQAQLETYVRSGEPNINYFASKKLTEKISLTFFGLVEQKWSEALIGASYAPSKSFNFAVSTGIEHGTKNPRFGASIWTGKGKTSLLMLGELGSGKDNYLYKSNLFYKCTDHFTFGITVWRFHGIGPNFRCTIPKLAITIWTMPAYDFESNESKLMIGLVINNFK